MGKQLKELSGNLEHKGSNSCIRAALRTFVKASSISPWVRHSEIPDTEAVHLLGLSYLLFTNVWICLLTINWQIRYRLEWEKRQRNKKRTLRNTHSLKSTPGDFWTDSFCAFIVNVTVLSDQETDDSKGKKKIYIYIYLYIMPNNISVSMWGGVLISTCLPNQVREESGHSRHPVSAHYSTPVKRD